MSKLTLVRGWLECSFDESKEMHSAILNLTAEARGKDIPSEILDLYMRGWVYPESPINWVSLVFFGAQVKSSAIPFIKEMVRIASSVGDEINGLFYVDDDDGEGHLAWYVSSGSLEERQRSE